MSFSSLWTWLSMPRHGIQLVIFIMASLGIGAIFLGLLCSVPPKFRKVLIMVVTFLGGLYIALEFLIPKHNVLTDTMPNVSNIQIVVGSFTLVLGTWNLITFHTKSITKKTAGRYNSIAFFIAFFAIMIAGFLKDASVKGIQPIFDILFTGCLLSLQATTFSLVAFYIVSAAYRAFRIKSAEAVLMMVAAAIIMLALVPIGASITAWLPKTGILSAFRLERIGYWILISPNMAVQRAIVFGIAVGAMATGLRIWLSLERGSYFDRQL